MPQLVSDDHSNPEIAGTATADFQSLTCIFSYNKLIMLRNRKIHLYITILTCLILCPPVPAAIGQKGKEPESRIRLVHAIDSILQGQVDDNLIPGAVVLVAKDGETVYQQAFGYARKYNYGHIPANPPEQMTSGHLFDLASLTKVIGTTTSIMLLADRGCLKIDDQVCSFVRAFDTPEKRTITIRQLLTHTAGLREWYPLYYLASDRQECFRVIASLPLRYPPGLERRYSDLGFIILGQIIETISGMPLESFMEQNIFRPLGMTNTTYNPLINGRFRDIVSTSEGNPYEKRMVYDPSLGFTVKDIDPDSWNGWRHYVLRGEVNDGNAWYACGGVSGAAGLFSTADDLQKLVNMLLRRGKSGEMQFLSEQIVGLFLTQDKFRNGLGWMMDPGDSFMKDAPAGSFGHTGFTGTSIVVVPRSGASVILLINRQNEGLSENGNYYNVTPVREKVFGAVMKYLHEEEGN